MTACVAGAVAVVARVEGAVVVAASAEAEAGAGWVAVTPLISLSLSGPRLDPPELVAS